MSFLNVYISCFVFVNLDSETEAFLHFSQFLQTNAWTVITLKQDAATPFHIISKSSVAYLISFDNT
jgi:hypothetical protein